MPNKYTSSISSYTISTKETPSLPRQIYLPPTIVATQRALVVPVALARARVVTLSTRPCVFVDKTEQIYVVGRVALHSVRYVICECHRLPLNRRLATSPYLNSEHRHTPIPDLRNNDRRAYVERCNRKDTIRLPNQPPPFIAANRARW